MSSAIATFITYTFVGAKTSPTWTVPNYEQIICSCDGGTRSVAVGGMSRCDYLPATNVILQRGPAGTLLILDGGVEFCSYLLRSEDATSARSSGYLSSAPGSICVVPFSSCTVIGLDTYVCNNSSGVLTVTWLRQAAYITLTVYGSGHEYRISEPGSVSQSSCSSVASQKDSAAESCEGRAVPTPENRVPDDAVAEARDGASAPREPDDVLDEIIQWNVHGPGAGLAGALSPGSTPTQTKNGEGGGDLLAAAMRESHLGVEPLSFSDIDVDLPNIPIPLPAQSPPAIAPVEYIFQDNDQPADFGFLSSGP
ncbi:nuclear protein UL4 [Falconid herpesvirus 1]|uniref:Nuclear protein UL4 n=2 Tax=Columbid alphaherpesvirus 1 TaxID=93386 RepID=A0A068EVU6_9ALPH|nr:nuclear protein UL4 [Falconid herpesvirus 1]YP_009352908.1 nuclear protein UL4 [Columbid alphaherpesvirus 1]AID52704.1 nuclear protein UL4 [Falconid herpesvirus 1]ARD71325.1 nuclear protein UL4 [Columbid alphaherpesvirus 1]